jgi:hypothetical protein
MEKTKFYPSELLLFKKPEIITCYKAKRVKTLRSTIPLEGGANPLQFDIPAEPNTYTDLQNTKLKLQVQITVTDGKTPATKDSKVICCQNLMHSIFKDLEMTINNTIITDPNQLYGYTSYFEKLIGNSKEVLKSRGELFGYGIDDYTKGIQKLTDDTTNPFIAAATAWCGDAGKKFTFTDNLCLPLCNQDLMLPANTTVRLKLSPQDPKFYMIGKDNTVTTSAAKVTILDAELYVAQTEYESGLHYGLEENRLKENVRYAFSGGRAQTITIPSGVNHFATQAMFQGKIPFKILMALVDDSAFTGAQSNLNPFYFEHANLQEVELKCGWRNLPLIPYKMNFADGDYNQAYESLLQNLGMDLIQDRALSITPKEWANGNTFFFFNVAIGPCDPTEPSVEPDVGDCFLEFTFRANTTKHYKCIVIGYGNQTLQIDKFNNGMLTQ